MRFRAPPVIGRADPAIRRWSGDLPATFRSRLLTAAMMVPTRCRPWSLTLLRKVIAMIAEDTIDPG